MTPATIVRSPPSTGKAGLVVREVRRPSFTESFVTGRPRAAIEGEAGARLLFGERAEEMAQREIAPMQEKVYGRSERRRGVSIPPTIDACSMLVVIHWPKSPLGQLARRARRRIFNSTDRKSSVASSVAGWKPVAPSVPALNTPSVTSK